jgi:hypothetical protein
MEKRGAVSVCVLVKGLANQVGENLCVGLGAKDMAATHKLLAEMLVVFDNSIVNESQSA